MNMDGNSNDGDANGTYGFFDAVYAADMSSPARLSAIVVFVLTQTLGNALLLGIVWYERHGSDTYYRTLINQVIKALIILIFINEENAVERCGCFFASSVESTLEWDRMLLWDIVSYKYEN